MRRGRAPVPWAIVLLVAGIAATVAGERMRPGMDGDPTLVAIDDPFDARYDAANDTTLLVSVHCHACTEPVGYLVQGDATGGLDARWLYLRHVGDGDRYAKVPVEPMELADGFVTREAYAGPFVLVDATWRVALLAGGLGLAGVGAALVLAKLNAASLGSAIVGPLAGLAFGWWGATQGDGGVVVFLVAPLVAAVGLLLLVASRTRAHAAGVVLGGVVAFAALLTLSSFYPAPSAI